MLIVASSDVAAVVPRLLLLYSLVDRGFRGKMCVLYVAPSLSRPALILRLFGVLFEHRCDSLLTLHGPSGRRQRRRSLFVAGSDW
jgi:hypothetical protein